jgi:hypothetical protein
MRQSEWYGDSLIAAAILYTPEVFHYIAKDFVLGTLRLLQQQRFIYRQGTNKSSYLF